MFVYACRVDIHYSTEHNHMLPTLTVLISITVQNTTTCYPLQYLYPLQCGTQPRATNPYSIDIHYSLEHNHLLPTLTVLISITVRNKTTCYPLQCLYPLQCGTQPHATPYSIDIHYSAEHNHMLPTLTVLISVTVRNTTTCYQPLQY